MPTLPPVWNVPFDRADQFFNRDDLLVRLGNELHGSGTGGAGPEQTDLRDDAPTAIQVLVGGSGSGKSSIAVEHAIRNADQLDLVWWLRARHAGTLLDDLSALAGELKLSGAEPAPVRVRDWLENTDLHWLLIVDDLESWSDLAQILPRHGNGQVVVTSGNRRLKSEGDVYDVTGFDQAGAAEFLQQRSGRTDPDGAARVAQHLGGMPLVLDIAGTYIARTGVDYATYLDLLTNGGLPEILPDADPSTVVEQVVAVTLAAVEQAAPNSAALSIALSSLAPEPIPQRLLARLDTQSEIVYIRVLQAMGLVAGNDHAVAMHPLVAEALVDMRAPESAEQSARFLLELLDRDQHDEDAASTAAVGSVATHVLATLAEADRYGIDAPSRGRLGVKAAGWLHDAGENDAALALARDALSRSETSLGPNDAVTRVARSQLADLLVERGETNEAIELQVRIVDDTERTHGPDDMRTLTARANLAANCELIGDHDRAIEYGEQAALELSRIVGPEHAEAAAARAVLARSYDAVGRHDDAAGLRGEATPPATQASIRGDGASALVAPTPPVPSGSSSSTAPPVPTPPAPMSSAAIADSSPATSTTDAAVAAEADEVERLTEEFGSEHPETLAARDALAGAYAGAGDHQMAIGLQHGILDDCERVFGSDHPDTLTARNNLASSFADAGDYARAVELQEQVLEEHESLLGADDQQTLVARNNLANSYAAIGAHAEALDLQQRVADDYERTLGGEHPNTLTALHNLANSYADSSRHQEALALRERVLADRERILGADHPQTLGARNNLANSYAETGQHEQALDLRRDVLADRERILGADHPQTLGARNNLANSYAETGQHEQAYDLRQQVLDERQRILGADHPHTLTARNNLANSLAGMGRTDEAMELRTAALADCERVLGPDHPHTLTARNNLANSYADAGDRAQAAELRTQVLADRERLLGVPKAGEQANRPSTAPIGLTDSSGRSALTQTIEAPAAAGKKKRPWSRKG